MATNDELYARIMERLGSEMPDLATQLKQEVRHGRVVSEKGLRQEGRYEERASRLAVSDLAPLGKTDVAAIPYTGDERLRLVCAALVTLAEAAYSSRRELLRMSQEFQTRPVVQFSSDDDPGDTAVVDLAGETAAAERTFNAVRELLADFAAEGGRRG
ncbi:hypothetical protein SK571_43765 [Lentzea sp. BCCO 10_0798]|uniref:Uncharacterized protein n=1 Tax=Lentzea kristufekii TaxID=3095430 RepID=A0ABU4U6Y2_9PSEU|nr:hypothetical protein [Lentzea sp. BCCO 10_0798]MDX8056335.1 hypothetical protein [Lentzea sp. BCCO 10_0798]